MRTLIMTGASRMKWRTTHSIEWRLTLTSSTKWIENSFYETLFTSFIRSQKPFALAAHVFSCRPSVSRKRSLHICGGDELFRSDDVVPGAPFAAGLEQSNCDRHSDDSAHRRHLSGLEQVSARNNSIAGERQHRSDHYLRHYCAVGRLVGLCSRRARPESCLGNHA